MRTYRTCAGLPPFLPERCLQARPLAYRSILWDSMMMRRCMAARTSYMLVKRVMGSSASQGRWWPPWRPRRPWLAVVAFAICQNRTIQPACSSRWRCCSPLRRPRRSGQTGVALLPRNTATTKPVALGRPPAVQVSSARAARDAAPGPTPCAAKISSPAARLARSATTTSLRTGRAGPPSRHASQPVSCRAPRKRKENVCASRAPPCR